MALCWLFSQSPWGPCQKWSGGCLGGWEGAACWEASAQRCGAVVMRVIPVQESCSSEEGTPSTLSESDLGQSSPDLMERMMGEWDEDGEEPPRTQQDSPVPPRR